MCIAIHGVIIVLTGQSTMTSSDEVDDVEVDVEVGEDTECFVIV
jgi:hypothetical protein